MGRTYSGNLRKRFIHSSASEACQIRSISSIAWAIGIELGISINPGESLWVTNFPKCRGIVRTSCVTKIRPSDIATARISGSAMPSGMSPCGTRSQLAVRDEEWLPRYLGQGWRPQGNGVAPYLGRASSRARFSFFDRLSGSGACFATNSCDKPSCLER